MVVYSVVAPNPRACEEPPPRSWGFRARTLCLRSRTCRPPAAHADVDDRVTGAWRAHRERVTHARECGGRRIRFGAGRPLAVRPHYALPWLPADAEFKFPSA